MNPATSSSSVNILDFKRHLETFVQFGQSNKSNQMKRVRRVLENSLKLKNATDSDLQKSRNEYGKWGWKEPTLSSIDYIQDVLKHQERRLYHNAARHVRTTLNRLNREPLQESNEAQAAPVTPNPVSRLQGKVVPMAAASGTERDSTASTTTSRQPHTGQNQSTSSKRSYSDYEEMLRAAEASLQSEKDKNANLTQEFTQLIALLQAQIANAQKALRDKETALRQKVEELLGLETQLNEMRIHQVIANLGALPQPQQGQSSDHTREVADLRQKLQVAGRTIANARKGYSEMQANNARLTSENDTLINKNQALMQHNFSIQQQFNALHQQYNALRQQYNQNQRQQFTPHLSPSMPQTEEGLQPFPVMSSPQEYPELIVMESGCTTQSQIQFPFQDSEAGPSGQWLFYPSS